MKIYYFEFEFEDYLVVVVYWECGEGVLFWNLELEFGWWLIEIGDNEDGLYVVYVIYL